MCSWAVNRRTKRGFGRRVHHKLYNTPPRCRLYCKVLSRTTFMRQSQFFAPTLRQVKADNPGHALLLRGAFIRQLGAGIYSYLPLGWRVLRKVEEIVREEMDRAGAIELLMPAMHPEELWAETGRDNLDILFKLQDVKGGHYLLGPTH